MALKQKADKPTKMKRKAYEKELQGLQVELCHLQDWVKETGARIIILFEGRDAAGKGGTIKAITERVSPRVFRVVALPAPTDRERTQMFGQRYIQRFPSAGEIIIFDRSWYNRAGVEYVMGFCSEEEHRVFLQVIPQIEKYVVDAGITLIKIWLEVGKDEQERRFSARINDPLRQWKLSPMDLESYRRWYAYSRARDQMFEKTDSKHAPWPWFRCLQQTDSKHAPWPWFRCLQQTIEVEASSPERAVQVAERRYQRLHRVPSWKLHADNVELEMQCDGIEPSTGRDAACILRRLR